MLNQLRFERNEFREYLIRFYKAIIDKDDIINFLY